MFSEIITFYMYFESLYLSCSYFLTIVYLYPQCFYFIFINLFFCFLGLYLWHMEVPRLGVQSELQLLAYAIATVIWDPSRVCNLHHSSGNARPLTHRARPGIDPATPWFLVGLVSAAWRQERHIFINVYYC